MGRRCAYAVARVSQVLRPGRLRVLLNEPERHRKVRSGPGTARSMAERRKGPQGPFHANVSNSGLAPGQARQ